MRWGLLLLATAVFAVACGEAETAERPMVDSPEPMSAATGAPVQAIHDGVWVEIQAGEGECVRASLSSYFAPADRRNCLHDGFVGYVTEGETTGNDGQVWRIAGQGWVLDSNVRFHHEGGFPYPPRPELADAGLIAYAKANSEVWLIGADGSGFTRLLNVEDLLGRDSFVEELAWSPSGDFIAVTVSLLRDMVRTYTVLVVDPSGSLVANVPNALLASWSNDGKQLALLAEHRGEQEQAEPVCIFLNAAVVGVLDLEAGSTTALTPHDCYFDGPEWSPYGNALLYTRDGSVYLYDLVSGAERVLRSGGESAFYWTVAWAPNGAQYATYYRSTSRGGDARDGYGVSLIDEGELLVSIADPAGGCGREAWFTDWQPSWTSDGRSLLYYEPCGEPGFGGVWVADISSGEAVRVASMEGAYSVDPSPDGQHLVFQSDGFLWVADRDGSDLMLLTDGYVPIWQPVPTHK